MTQKQTAVEWLIEIVNTQGWDLLWQSNKDEICKIAKQMENKQMINKETEINEFEIDSAADRFILNNFDFYREFTSEEIWFLTDAFIKGAKWYNEKLKEKL